MPNLGPTELIIIGFVLLIVAAIVLTVLRALSPSPGRCVQILRRWGVEQPTAEQGELLSAYFRSRRKIYLPVFVVVGVVVALLVGYDWITIGLTTILAGLLVIELGAVLRPAFRGKRSAALVQRGLTDLVPPFAIVSYGLVAVIGLAFIVVNLLAQPDAWVPLAGYVVFVGAGVATVWASLVRAPMFDDGMVDAALRLRSARVSAGVSLLLLSFVSMGALLVYGFWLAPAVLVIAMINWLALLNPTRKQRLVEASR
jgi:hypothetical protein